MILSGDSFRKKKIERQGIGVPEVSFRATGETVSVGCSMCEVVIGLHKTCTNRSRTHP